MHPMSNGSSKAKNAPLIWFFADKIKIEQDN